MPISSDADEARNTEDLVLATDETATPSPAPEKAAAEAETTKADPSKADAKSVASADTGGKAAAAEKPGADEKNEADETAQTENAIDAKRKGFLSAFFSPAPNKSDTAALAAMKKAAPAPKSEDTKPLIKLASADPGDDEEIIHGSITGPDALPGVRSGDQLFEISRKSGVDDDISDVDVYENIGSYDVAYAGGFARGAHGLLTQRPDVDVTCLKPGLVRILKTIERHYGKKVLVTSGYRSPAHNRRVHGAKHSQHMYCAAADIKVAGISKWELARYVRAMPGRGGVGTYCHTNAIHVDVGPERDWNWRCNRRK